MKPNIWTLCFDSFDGSFSSNIYFFNSNLSKSEIVDETTNEVGGKIANETVAKHETSAISIALLFLLMVLLAITLAKSVYQFHLRRSSNSNEGITSEQMNLFK